MKPDISAVTPAVSCRRPRHVFSWTCASDVCDALWWRKRKRHGKHNLNCLLQYSKTNTYFLKQFNNINSFYLHNFPQLSFTVNLLLVLILVLKYVECFIITTYCNIVLKINIVFKIHIPTVDLKWLNKSTNIISVGSSDIVQTIWMCHLCTWYLLQSIVKWNL